MRAKISGVDLAYPEAARLARIEGRVLVWLHVDAGGNVTRVEIKQSPHDLLSQEATTKFLTWRLRPPVANKPFIVEETVDFRLINATPTIN